MAAPAIRADQTPQPAPGFVDETVLTGLDLPTAMAFSPDGRVFVAEKSGLIKVFASLSDPTPAVFADLRTEVQNYWDRGLLGLALDPNFPATPNVYVLYSHDAPIGGTAPTYGDGCPPDLALTGCIIGGRLSRLTMAPDGTWTGDEHVLIEDWFQQYGSHSIGSLVFGADGALYASGGEGASWDVVDYGQTGNPANAAGDPPVPIGGTQTPPTAEGGALRAQDLRTPGDPVGLSGSIIRIDPNTGEGLPDNPLASQSDPNARRIVAYGFRNPFRFTVQPGTGDLWIGDVGWGDYEELNVAPQPSAAAGAMNFGWPCYEGGRRQPGYEAAGLDICSNLYADGTAVAPLFQYRHGFPAYTGDTCTSANGSSISGLAFYRGGGYPAIYNNALFVADYSRQCIWVMHAGPDGQPSPDTVQSFVTNAATPVQLTLGPGGDLFYVDMGGGTIHRVRYDGGQPPVAALTATPWSGHTPLTVAFDGSASHDPEGDPLTYSWDLNGDGVFGDAAGPTATYTYDTDGNVTVGLQVKDTAGKTGTATTTVVVGNTAPVPVIDAPAGSLLWHVGELVAFSGHAVDAEDGPLADTTLRWDLLLHHCTTPTTCHIHYLQQFTGASGTFVAPDHPYPSYLTLRLSATDHQGITGSTDLELDPQTMPFTIATVPSGLPVAVAGQLLTSPVTQTLIVGSNLSVSAPSPAVRGGDAFAFAGWSDGGAQAHDLVATPGATSVTAMFTTLVPAPIPGWTSTDIGNVGPSGFAVQNGDVLTVGGAGADVWNTADAFHFLSQPLTGDGTITARVSGITGAADWTKAGVMIRAANAASDAHAFMLVSIAKGTAFQRRPASGASSASTAGPNVTAPYWVRLIRHGTTVTGEVSTDGATWTTIGAATIALPDTVQAGLAVTSHDATRLATATFDHLQIDAAPPPSSSTLPDGWQDSDIGDVGQSGSALASDGTFTVHGSGNDVWGDADAFHFAWQPLTGNGAITARVAAASGAEAWTKVGVMIRAGTDADAAHAFMLVSAGKGVAFQRRRAAGADSLSTAGPMVGAPYWVRLTRHGGLVIGEASSDGSTWTPVGSDTIALPATALVGIAVTAHDSGLLATGSVDHVQIEPLDSTTPALPDGWESLDIGTVGGAGFAQATDGTFTIGGGGADVWGTADAFHFAATPIAGDGSIIARVRDVDGPTAWTKVGVMIRASEAPDAAHAFALVSLGKGIAFQRRPTTGANSLHTPGPDVTAPQWVRLTRHGTTITADTSADGVSWTTIGTDTVALPDTALFGLAVTSHDATHLATATIDNVTIDGAAPAAPAAPASTQ